MNYVQKPVPSHIAPDRVVDVDYFNMPGLHDDPYATLVTLQQHPHGMVWTTARGGHWIATRRDVIYEILETPDVFSSVEHTIPPMAYRMFRLVPEELDPPEHTKYRKILNPLFSPRVMGNFADKARPIAQAVLDRIYPHGTCDITKELSVPLPVTIFLHLFGLPPENTDQFLAWKDGFLFNEDPTVKKASIDSIMDTVSALIEERRSAPKKDMVSDLLAAKVDGRALNEEELRSIGFLLFIGGLDTVTNTLSGCIAHIAQNPDDQKKLRDNPDLIPDAIEEILRRFSIVNPVRTVKKDFEIDGVTVRVGEQVMASTILANLDDKVVGSPMSVVLDRQDNAHLAFGAGPHRCVGSHLARSELRVVLEEVLKKLPNIRIKPGHKLHYHSANLVGLQSLPIEWDVK